MKEISVKKIISYLEEEKIEFEFYGDDRATISGFSGITNYLDNSVTWIKSNSIKYDRKKRITLCIVQQGIQIEADAIILSPNSKAVFFSILEHFFGEKDSVEEKIGKGTVIGPEVQIGKNVYIGHNCSVYGDIKIGEGTVIYDNVVIKNKVVIGENCTIQSLSVIGEDGFGYSEDKNHVKTMIKHYGGVCIGNNVFIGSHVNIARGTIDDTIISDGVKIAPTTHIGHNNMIGKNATIICSQLFGSVEIGENSYITSSVVRNQCKVGNNSLIGMGSVVTKNIESSKVAIGVPAKVLRDNAEEGER